MKSKTSSLKIGFDLFFLQLKWSGWFFAALLAFGLIFRAGVSGDESQALLSFAFKPAKVYMLALGTAAISFLVFYVKFGVTRKKHFRGTLYALFALSLAVTLMFAVVTELLGLITGEITAFSDFRQNGPETLFTVWMNVLSYYIAGWLIGSGYYRYGWMACIGFIVLAGAMIGITDVLWEFELHSLLSERLPFDPSQLPLYASLLGSLVLLGLILAVIFMVNRRTPVKLK